MDGDLSLVGVSTEGKELAAKPCPVCGQELFDDMDVCYGCLHDFKKRPSIPLGFPPTLFAEGGRRQDAWAPSADPLHAQAKRWELEDPAAEEALPALSLGDGQGAPPDVATEVFDVPSPSSLCLRLQTSEVEADMALGPPGLLIGRSSSCDVVLHAPAVSRRHVRVMLSRAGVLVEDQGATNPARLQGRPVEGSALMAEGETLEVCGARFTLRSK